MIGAAFSSFGVTTALIFGLAAYAPWKSVKATEGVQVPVLSRTVFDEP